MRIVAVLNFVLDENPEGDIFANDFDRYLSKFEQTLQELSEEIKAEFDLRNVDISVVNSSSETRGHSILAGYHVEFTGKDLDHFSTDKSHSQFKDFIVKVVNETRLDMNKTCHHMSTLVERATVKKVYFSED